MRSGTIAFLCGIAVVQLLPRLPAWPWLLAAALALVPLLWLRRHRPVRLAVWAAVGGLWALSIASAHLAHILPSRFEKRDLVVTGRVVGLPQVQPWRTRFLLRTQAGPIGAGLRLRLSWYHAPPLHPGERWRLQVRLTRPHGMADPGSFDYERWLFLHDIVATGYVRRGGPHRQLAPASGAWLARGRDALRTRLKTLLAGSPRAGLLAALAVGARGGISQAQWAVLRRTGTSHLVAISGLHIGMVAGLVFLLLRWLWSRSSRTTQRLAAPRAAAVAALLAAAVYAALAGFSLPTQRALIMLVVGLGAVALGRNLQPSRTLALALLLVLVWDPLAVLGIGFWLSFGAVAAILFAAAGRLGRGGRVRQLVSTQAVVTVGLLPLLALAFGRISLVAPLANLVAIPWVGVAVVPPLLMGVLLLPLWPAAAALPIHLADAALAPLWGALSRLAVLPWAVHPLAAPAWTLVPALLGALWLLAPRGWPARPLGIVGLLPLLLAGPVAPPPGAVRVTVLDVGQGLATVVRTARHTLVFDTGPRYRSGFDTGRAVVVPFLRQAGVDRVDTLVLSHANRDHTGGARSLLAAIPVKRILAGDPVAFGHGAVRCRRGQQWMWDGVHFRMLGPAAGAPQDENDRSCVLSVATPAGRVLFTGDMEEDGEQALLAVADPGRLRSRVLVVPHHGSRTSSTPAFVAAVDPQAAIFSVGYRNRYHLPASAVVARYRRAGAQILRTDRSGAVSVTLGPGPQRLVVHRYREETAHYWGAMAVGR